MTRHAGADLPVMRLLRLAVLGVSNQVESTQQQHSVKRLMLAHTWLVVRLKKEKKRAVCVFYTGLH